LVGLLVGWLVGWLVCWLVGWLVGGWVYINLQNFSVYDICFLYVDFSTRFPVLLWVTITPPTTVSISIGGSGDNSPGVKANLDIAYRHHFTEKPYSGAACAPELGHLFVATATAVSVFGPRGLQHTVALTTLALAPGPDCCICGVFLITACGEGTDSARSEQQLVVSGDNGRFYLLGLGITAAAEPSGSELLVRASWMGVDGGALEDTDLEGKLKQATTPHRLPFGVQTGMQILGSLGEVGGPQSSMYILGHHASSGMQLLEAKRCASVRIKKGPLVWMSAHQCSTPTTNIADHVLDRACGVRSVIPLRRRCVAVAAGLGHDQEQWQGSSVAGAAASPYDSYILINSYRGNSSVSLCRDGFTTVSGQDGPWELALEGPAPDSWWSTVSEMLVVTPPDNSFSFCLMSSRVLRSTMVLTLPESCSVSAAVPVPVMAEPVYVSDEATLLWEGLPSCGLIVQVTCSQVVFLHCSGNQLAKVSSCDLLQRCQLLAGVSRSNQIQHAALTTHRGGGGAAVLVVLVVTVGAHVFSFGSSLSTDAGGAVPKQVELVPLHEALQVPGCASCIATAILPLPDQPPQLVVCASWWGAETEAAAGVNTTSNAGTATSAIPAAVGTANFSVFSVSLDVTTAGTAKLLPAAISCEDARIEPTDPDSDPCPGSSVVVRGLQCSLISTADGHTLALLLHGSSNPHGCTRLRAITLFVPDGTSTEAGALCMRLQDPPVSLDVPGGLLKCTCLSVFNVRSGGVWYIHGVIADAVITLSPGPPAVDGAAGFEWRYTSVCAPGPVRVSAVVPPRNVLPGSGWRYAHLSSDAADGGGSPGRSWSLHVSNFSPGLSQSSMSSMHIRCCRCLHGSLLSHRLVHSGGSQEALPGASTASVYLLLTMETTDSVGGAGSVSLLLLDTNSLETVWSLAADALTLATDSGPTSQHMATVAIEVGMSPAAALYSNPTVSNTDSSGYATAGAADAYFVVSFRCWPKVGAVTAASTVVQSYRLQHGTAGTDTGTGTGAACAPRVSKIGSLVLPPSPNNSAPADAALLLAALGGLKHCVLFSQTRGRLEVMGWSLGRRLQRLGLGGTSTTLSLGLLSTPTRADAEVQPEGVDEGACSAGSAGPCAIGASAHPAMGLTSCGDFVCLNRFRLGVEVYGSRIVQAAVNHTGTADTNSSESQKRRARSANSEGNSCSASDCIVLERLFVVPEPIVGFRVLYIDIARYFAVRVHPTDHGHASSGRAPAVSECAQGYEYSVAGTSKWQHQRGTDTAPGADIYMMRGYHSCVPTATESASISNLSLPPTSVRQPLMESFAAQIYTPRGGENGRISLTRLMAPMRIAAASTSRAGPAPPPVGATATETTTTALAATPAAGGTEVDTEGVATAVLGNAVPIATVTVAPAAAAGDGVSVSVSGPTSSVGMKPPLPPATGVVCAQGTTLSAFSFSIGGMPVLTNGNDQGRGQTPLSPTVTFNVLCSSDSVGKKCHFISTTHM